MTLMVYLYNGRHKMGPCSEEITVTEEKCQVLSAAQMHQSSIQTLE